MIHKCKDDIDTDLIYIEDKVYLTYLSKGVTKKLYDKANQMGSCKLLLIGENKFHFKCVKYEHRKKIIKEINGE